MNPAARIGSASLFALVSILSIGSAAATEATPPPDPQLCAEYLRDLKAYRRMAVLLGCKIPGSDEVAALGSSETQFPPVVGEAAAPSPDEFPPAADAPATSETEQGFPPVVDASTEPAADDFPPVASESTSTADQGSGTGSGGGSGSPDTESSSFPPVETSAASIPDETVPDETVEESADPIRAAIKEKLITFKEEAKARIRDAIAAKAEEVKERVKEKIKHKIEDAISHHHHDDGAATLRGAAKDAVKRAIGGSRHHGGGVAGKLARLLRR